MTKSSEGSRQRLGRELRYARKAAGRTQSEAAAVLRCGQGKVAKIEGTLVNIGERDLDELMYYYKLPELKKAELRELHRISTVPRAVPGYPGRSEAFVKLVSAETDASEILGWHSERVPGPLQHVRYMLKQFELDQTAKRESVRTALAARRSRLNIFNVDRPPHYRVVLSESALYRLPGGWTPKLELDQIGTLRSLLKMYRGFELRILPFAANLAYADPDFTLLRFARGTSAAVDHEDFVYLEHIGGAQIVKDISKFIEYWDVLVKASLSREESLAWLNQRFDHLVSPEVSAKWNLL
ncbi:MAG TPA: helix-turn-helix transcriptional regulator [Pseudonocardiaceae bacterium]|nr:helix-turn-helix transcriptional regulator [Pseudonocardiaceae bacterium]